MNSLNMFSSGSTSSKLFPVGLKEEIEKPSVTSSQGVATQEQLNPVPSINQREKLVSSHTDQCKDRLLFLVLK